MTKRREFSDTGSHADIRPSRQPSGGNCSAVALLLSLPPRT
jgi:hypothetical protein